jgi:hypothetical protein
VGGDCADRSDDCSSASIELGALVAEWDSDLNEELRSLFMRPEEYGRVRSSFEWN